MLAQALAAVAFERQAGGVHEHHREIGKQITTALEQPLFDHILDATRRRGRPGGLLDGLAEPRHRAVKMMQAQSLRTADVIVGHPRHAVPVGARDKQPVQGCHEHGTLDGKAELARHQQAIQHLADAELLPQPANSSGPPIRLASSARLPSSRSSACSNSTWSVSLAPEASNAASAPDAISASARPRLAITAWRTVPPIRRLSTI